MSSPRRCAFWVVAIVTVALYVALMYGMSGGWAAAEASPSVFGEGS